MNGRDTFYGSDYLERHRANVYSQFGEDGVVDAILSAIGEGSRWAFECGAADGIMFSNTRRLLDRGWTVHMVEANPIYTPALSRLSARFANLRVHTETLAVDGLDAMLAKLQAPIEPTLLCIDIDGQDWHAWNGMINHYPMMVMIEHAHHPDWHDRVPDLGEKGQAGPFAIERLSCSKGYDVVARTITNSICVRHDLVKALREVEGT